MIEIPIPPFRHAFDAGRDPYTARNALGIIGNGGALVPPGGTTGQVLSKNSGSDYDIHWAAGGSTVTPSPLTKTDDTNVTLTLGGTPATALLQATSITVGWTGTLANGRLATMAAHTYKGNNSGATATPIDVTNTQLTADLNLFTSALQGLAPASGGGTTNFLRADATWAAPSAPTLPTQQIFTSGSGTYTRPANCRRIEIRMIGGGAGGGGSGNTGYGLGGAGGNTTFGTSLLVANGGGGTTDRTGGLGGSFSLGGVSGQGWTGASGGGADYVPAAGPQSTGGQGASTPFGGGGGGGGGSGVSGLNGYPAQTNTGAGGGGAGTGSGAPLVGGAGGGAGGYIEAFINSPAATYSYAVGTAGSAGGAGTGGAAGGAGGSGIIIVKEFY